MSSEVTTISPSAPAWDLAKWRKLPRILAIAGGVLALIGALTDSHQFAYSYLLAFMFFLSICLASLLLVILHHLFDASWSVPIRRYCEHLAFLAPWMFLLFIPIALLAPKLYPWMQMAVPDHALHAKQALLNKPFFYIRALLYFAIWSFLAYKLRYWSLKQDQTAAPECTYKMRRYAAVGIFLVALTLTLAAIDWMKSLQHQWFSTMYGVYYFAGSMWMTLPTVYVIGLVLRQHEPFRTLLSPTVFYYIGSLMLAFTVFYAYIHFSQYFIISNANMPEETFWYRLREQGSWWDIGMLIIFGHFFVPFLMLLRIDFKLKLVIIVPLAIWAWLMHFADLSFNIMPVAHPTGFWLDWRDLACLIFIGGVLAEVFLRYFASHPPYPIRDPRLKEAMTSHEIPVAAVEGGAH